MSMIPSARTSNPLDRAGVLRVDYPARGRLPGPTREVSDPGASRKLAYIQQAWALARTRYIARAIRRSTNADFQQVIRGASDALLLKFGHVGGTAAFGRATGGSVAGLGLGVDSLTDAMAGARLGSSLGMGLLDWLGLGFLVGGVANHLDVFGTTLARGTRTAWNSGGTPQSIDSAACDIADAFGSFFGLLLRAIVADMAQAPVGNDMTVAGLSTKWSNTRLDGLSDDLTGYLHRDRARLFEVYGTEAG
jgi:hypothetical protein